MRPIKNKRKIDPRYFLHETTHRDELGEGLYEGSKSEDSGSKPGKAPSVPGKPDPGTQPDKPFPETPVSGPLSESLSSRYGPYNSKKPTKKRQLSKDTKYKYKLNK